MVWKRDICDLKLLQQGGHFVAQHSLTRSLIALHLSHSPTRHCLPFLYLTDWNKHLPQDLCRGHALCQAYTSPDEFILPAVSSLRSLLKHHLDCSPARTPNKKIVAALHSLLYLLLFSSSHLSLSDLLYHYFICLYAFSVAGLYRFFFLSIQYPCLNSAWKMSDSQYIFLN